MNPKVSVILPSYNAEQYIETAVQSALAQTEKRLEVLVSDDGSTDNTESCVRAINDSRIRFLPGAANGGPGHARNRALRHAQGEWVAFLDADDWYAPERLEKLIRTAEENRVDLVADDMYRIPDRPQKRVRTKLEAHHIKKLTFLDATDYLRLDCGMQPLVQREFLEKHHIFFDERFRHGEDTLFIFECLLVGARLALLPEPMYYYAWRSDSLTTRKMEGLQQRRQIARELLARECIRRNPVIREILENRYTRAEEWMRFLRVMEPLKKGKLKEAFRSGLFRPHFILTLCKALPSFLKNCL